MGRLRDKMEGDLKLKGASENTRKTYLYCAAGFVRHYGKPATDMGRTEVRDYLLHWVEVLPIRTTVRYAQVSKTRLETARRELEQSASTVRAQQQALRDALATAPEEPVSPKARWREMVELLTGVDLGACPVCGSRNLEREPLPRAPPATITSAAR